MVAGATEDDEGRYQCLAKNLAGVRGSEKADLTIQGEFADKTIFRFFACPTFENGYLMRITIKQGQKAEKVNPFLSDWNVSPSRLRLLSKQARKSFNLSQGDIISGFKYIVINSWKIFSQEHEFFPCFHILPDMSGKIRPKHVPYYGGAYSKVWAYRRGAISFSAPLLWMEQIWLRQKERKYTDPQLYKYNKTFFGLRTNI